jgi:hypothetical protein
MKVFLLLLPWLALSGAAALIGKALSQFQVRHPALFRRQFAAVIGLALLVPQFAHAAVDLQTATESGNAIIMYVCGSLVAVGIVTAGVAMMTGRQSIAKWAFAGALVAGLAFPIVKTMWSNIGLTPPDVSTYTP